MIVLGTRESFSATARFLQQAAEPVGCMPRSSLYVKLKSMRPGRSCGTKQGKRERRFTSSLWERCGGTSITCEGEDGAVRTASGEEVGHVAAACEDKDGRGPQIIRHGSRRRAQLLAGAPIGGLSELWQDDVAMLLLPGTPPACTSEQVCSTSVLSSRETDRMQPFSGMLLP